MAAEYFILRQLERMMAEPTNRDYWLRVKMEQDPIKRLTQLTQHHNGHIRQRAVLCLGMMQSTEALPALIVRANDWASQVRTAALQSIRQFITPKNADLLVSTLPHFFSLLQGERDNHQRLMDEVLAFLSRPENQSSLLKGVDSADKNVARDVTAVLVDRALYPGDILWQGVKQHNDALVRLMVARAMLASDRPLYADLLKDSYAPVKQIALQHLLDGHITLPVSSLQPLLLDHNELVRRRAARLLEAQGGDPSGYYLAIFSAASRKVAQRSVALRGLHEKKYAGVLVLALANLAGSPALGKTALQIVINHKQEEARDCLLAALGNTSRSVARMASRWMIKLKLYITLNELQQLVAHAPEPAHIRLYFTLASRLNLWDSLIFFLRNSAQGDEKEVEQSIDRCLSRANHFFIAPSPLQKERLTALLAQHKGLTIAPVLMRRLAPDG